VPAKQPDQQGTASSVPGVDTRRRAAAPAFFFFFLFFSGELSLAIYSQLQGTTRICFKEKWY
jgi:hypothetical protein